jgi:hypothetical protein
MAIQDDYDYVQPPGWVQVKPDAFADAPFEMWVNNFKSSEPRTEAFLHDPRAFLTGQVMEDYGGVKGEPIEGVTSETRIQTWITNHHKTLEHMVLYASAIRSTEENTVSLTLYKKEPGGH